MSKLMSFTGTVLKSLFSKPATTAYPAKPAEYPERTRGHVEMIDVKDCILCGLCEKSCPPGAIKVDRNGGTWSIQRFDCIQCGYCVDKCPKKTLKIIPGYQEPGAEKTPETLVVKDVTAEAEAAGGAKGGKPKANLDECVFCGLCAKNCPASAIEVDRAAKSWKLNEEACVGCGLCKTKCPKKCIEME
ncbi:MAG: 4Fe-4S binding protein [Lachnospiraceae bacterium]|nr:4Fe-4S binding protein [Lachnospiraceae bacterium]